MNKPHTLKQKSLLGKKLQCLDFEIWNLEFINFILCNLFYTQSHGLLSDKYD